MRLLALFAALFVFAANANASLLSGTGGAPNFGTVIDFDSAPTGEFPSITLSGVTFSGLGAPISIGPDFIGSYNTRGTQSLFTDFDLNPDVIRIDFTSPVTKFAFNWGAADNHWKMTVFDSTASVIESHLIAPVFASNAGDYYGVSASDIKFILLEDQFDRFADGDYVFIDDFSFDGAGGTVPEPSSLAIALGLATLVGVSRRRRLI